MTVVWRTIKRKLQRSDERVQVSQLRVADAGYVASERVGWNWSSDNQIAVTPAEGPVSDGEERHTAANSTAVVSVGYRVDVVDNVEAAPRRRTSVPALEPDERRAAGRHRRAAQSLSAEAAGARRRRMAPATDVDLERMATALLYGVVPNRHDGGHRPPSTTGGDAADGSAAEEMPTESAACSLDVRMIQGIGATMAARLMSCGIDSVGALAGLADDEIDDLAETTGTFPSRLAEWVAAARAIEVTTSSADARER